MRHIKLFETVGGLGYALFNAIRFLNTKDIKTILDAVNNVNIINKSGKTPLITAVSVANASQSKIIKVIRLLVRYGANLDIQDIGGYTALIKSAMKQRYDVMYELIEIGAEWYLKDYEELDFIDYVKMADDDESTKLFEELIEKYPEKYKEYLMKKDADKYNM